MTFTPDELDRIVDHLAATGEIDARFSYMGGGAATWDRFVSFQESDTTPNILHSTRDPEIGFDGETRERYLRIRLTGPVTPAGRLALPAGQRVHLWRYYHRSAEELTAMLGAAGYPPLTVRRSADGEFALVAGLR
ncbi:hypothetical protein [Actinoplanes sp. NPDC026619]|uniref:hypothetical protein n=1 Tax=Actinoplanes sp. NPDC026619 TaxID=3155798 RepID=UPI0034087129